MSPIPLPEVAGPNELLGRLLLNYQEDHPRGSALDDTLPQQYVRTRRHLRLADRLIWTGLGRLPDVRRDLPSIAVEFVSGTGPRAQQFYYADKREEYLAVGIREYWIFDRFPQVQVSQPTMSSWGYKGYCEVWLEGSNDWIYRHLHEAADRMVELARGNPDPAPLRRRALNQASRELLLAQSSDWAFIMKTGTMVDYAKERTRVHVLNFNHLYDILKDGDIDESWLAEIERRHNLFPDVDYRVYA